MTAPASLVRRVIEDIDNAMENVYNLLNWPDGNISADLINCTTGYEEVIGFDLDDAVRQAKQFILYRNAMKARDQTITRIYFKDEGTCFIVKRLMFHWTLLVSGIGNFDMYDDRWCYATQTGPNGAQDAVERWIADNTEEPTMWHRHHKTGRRRPHGDASKEYISQYEDSKWPKK